MVPSVVLSVDFIPTTLSGKTDRRALLSLVVEGKATHRSGGIGSSVGQHMVPKSPLEEAVLAIYRRELKREGIGMGSGFIENGGDSLKAVRIVASLRALHDKHPELQRGKGFSTLFHLRTASLGPVYVPAIPRPYVPEASLPPYARQLQQLLLQMAPHVH